MDMIKIGYPLSTLNTIPVCTHLAVAVRETWSVRALALLVPGPASPPTPPGEEDTVTRTWAIPWSSVSWRWMSMSVLLTRTLPECTPRAAEALGILPLSHRTLKVPFTLMARTIRTRPILMTIRPPVAAARGIFPAIILRSVRNRAWTDGVSWIWI